MRRLIVSGGAVLVSALSLPAYAVPEQPAEGGATCSEQAASQYFTQGTALAHNRKHVAAIAAFTAAYRCQAHPAALYNIAQSYIHLENHALALWYLERYLAEHKGSLDQERESEVREQIRLLLDAVPDEPAEAGVAAGLEGGATPDLQEPYGPAPAGAEAAPSAPGTAAPPVESGAAAVMTPPYREQWLSNQVSDGLGPSTLAPATEPRADVSYSSRRTWAMVLAGAGLAAGGAAVGLFVSNHERESEWERTDAELNRARRRALSAPEAEALNARQTDNNRRAHSIRTHGVAAVALSASALVALLGAGYVELLMVGPEQAHMTLGGNHVSIGGNW